MISIVMYTRMGYSPRCLQQPRRYFKHLGSRIPGSIASEVAMQSRHAKALGHTKFMTARTKHVALLDPI